MALAQKYCQETPISAILSDKYVTNVIFTVNTPIPLSQKTGHFKIVQIKKPT